MIQKNLSPRERILTLLSGQTPDHVPWFADLDYWYHAAQSAGTLDPLYAGDGYFRLNNDLGTGFYLQGFGPYHQKDSGVSWSEQRNGQQVKRTLHTPVGDLDSIRQYLPQSSSWGIVKHLVEEEGDLRPFLYYIRQMQFEPAYAEVQRRKDLLGDQGIVLCYTPRSPFMQLATEFCGVTNLVYLLADEPDGMAEILTVLEEKHDLAAQITVHAAADCVMIPENLSSEVVGIYYYLKYLRPYENRWIQQIRQAGQYSFIHMDGTLRGLIQLVAETGFDVIEAVTPEPGGDMTMDEIIDLIGGSTVLWGGLPGSIFTASYDESDFIGHVRHVISLMRRQPRFVLGVADQVPPDGLLSRVAKVYGLCAAEGRY